MTEWEKFAPGGEHYEAVKTQHGQAAADYVASIAERRNAALLQAALADIASGERWRYQPGGDVYQRWVDLFGLSKAEELRRLWNSGDLSAYRRRFADFNAERAEALGGPTSTWSLFFGQLYNDPFTAPIEQAERVLGNTVQTVARSPLFFGLSLGGLILVALVLWGFFKIGGAKALAKVA